MESRESESQDLPRGEIPPLGGMLRYYYRGAAQKRLFAPSLDTAPLALSHVLELRTSETDHTHRWQRIDHAMRHGTGQ